MSKAFNLSTLPCIDSETLLSLRVSFVYATFMFISTNFVFSVPDGVIRIFHDNQLLPEIIDRGHRKSLTPFRFIKFSTDQKEEFDFYYDCSPPEIRSLASVWRASNAANHISLKWSIFMPMFFVYTFLFRNI